MVLATRLPSGLMKPARALHQPGKHPKSSTRSSMACSADLATDQSSTSHNCRNRDFSTAGGNSRRKGRHHDAARTATIPCGGTVPRGNGRLRRSRRAGTRRGRTSCSAPIDPDRIRKAVETARTLFGATGGEEGAGRAAYMAASEKRGLRTVTCRAPSSGSATYTAVKFTFRRARHIKCRSPMARWWGWPGTAKPSVSTAPKAGIDGAGELLRSG